MTRRERFINLLDQYAYPTDPDEDDADSTGEEDALAHLAGEDPIERYAVVFVAKEDITSILARWSTLDAAKHGAVENVNDDIFAEAPLKIVDLDTGATFHPRFDTLAWGSEHKLPAGFPFHE